MNKELLVTNSNPIVKLKTFTDAFVVHWFIGKRCNFDCSYCPSMWHDKTSKDLSYDMLIRAWNRIVASTQHKKDIKYNLTILGGEPTLNKDFLPFIRWLHTEYKDKIVELGVISNGTAKAEYYKELAEYCTWITFTIHSEFTNEKKFFDTVLETKQHADQIGCMVHVNIMDEHRNLLKNKKLKEFLTTKNISNYLHPIHDFEENKVAHPIKRLDEIYEYDTNPR
jgi:MoaA/NifB/PqqE/SkfB family radical SAM enzyme